MNSRNPSYATGNAEQEPSQTLKTKSKKNQPEEASEQLTEEIITGAESKNESKKIIQTTEKVGMEIEGGGQPTKENSNEVDEEKLEESRFVSTAAGLKQKISNLQKRIADYSTSESSSATLIASLIQECLIDLSVESLSQQELAEYLGNDMGKLLFALSNQLDEFEKRLHQASQTLPAMVVRPFFAQLTSNNDIDQEEKRLCAKFVSNSENQDD